MKYLKTFENKKLKTYIIYELNYRVSNKFTKLYYILENVGINKDERYIDVIALYNTNNGVIEKSNESTTQKLGLHNPILYQSDNLEECLEELERILLINKYNL